MSGHSKWNNIKHRKRSQNKKKNKIFSKIIRKINFFSKSVNSSNNIQFDKKFQSVMHTALLNNVRKNTLYRIINKNTNKNDYLKKKENAKSIWYEGYGVSKVALLIECINNNRNRIVSDIRNVLSKFGGNLINNGSIMHLFRKAKIFTIKEKKLNDQTIIDIKNKINTDHFFIKNNQSTDIFVYDKKSETNIIKIIQKNGFLLESSRMEFVPLFFKEIKKQEIEIFSKLISNINKIYDVKKIYHNGKFSKKD